MTNKLTDTLTFSTTLAVCTLVDEYAKQENTENMYDMCYEQCVLAIREMQPDVPVEEMDGLPSYVQYLWDQIIREIEAETKKPEVPRNKDNYHNYLHQLIECDGLSAEYLVTCLCNYFSTDQLKDFVEYLDNEMHAM